jgi:hypothetical protein
MGCGARWPHHGQCVGTMESRLGLSGGSWRCPASVITVKQSHQLQIIATEFRSLVGGLVFSVPCGLLIRASVAGLWIGVKG